MAIEINGFKFFSKKITKEKIDWLKVNYQSKKLAEIEEHLDLCDATVYRLLDALQLNRERHYDRSLPNTKEVLEKLKNPYLSHVKIAEEYGVHETTVGHRRKALGINVRRNMVNNRLEDHVQDILDELDLAYIPQKPIKPWSIDFYLGRKHCLDVHGDDIHSNPIVQDRDKRKTAFLKKNGYKYLAIYESQLHEAKSLIQDFVQGFPSQ